MFDLSRLRTLNLDALRPWRIYTLRQTLVTRDGRRCEAGSSFRFEHAIVDVPARCAEIHGLGPLNEALVFDSRDDAHRLWFGDTGQEWRPGSWTLGGAPAPEAQADADEDGAPPQGDALAAALRRLGHAEAADVLAGLRRSGGWGGARDDADVLAACARMLARGPGPMPQTPAPPLARAVADAALTLYHAWMSQATSGGEGAAMQGEIARPLAEMRQLAGLPAVRRSRLP